MLDGARIIYDAEAVFAKREIARAALEGRPYSEREAEALCQEEIGLADGVDGITCVTDTEAKLFRDRKEAPVYVISHRSRPGARHPRLRLVMDSCSLAACWSTPRRTG